MKLKSIYLQVIVLGDEIEIDSEAGFVGIVEAGDDIDEPFFGSIPPFHTNLMSQALTSLLIIHLVNILNFLMIIL